MYPATAPSDRTPFSTLMNWQIGVATSTIVGNLQPGTTYFARLRAFDAVMNVSSNSAIRSDALLYIDELADRRRNQYHRGQPTTWDDLLCTPARIRCRDECIQQQRHQIGRPSLH